MHRWDAVGGPIDAALAVDGVDELLELFVPRLPAERLDGAARVRSTCTPPTSTASGSSAWRRRGSPSSTATPRATSRSAARASDLLLWSWNRVPVDDRFEVFGDAALLDAWRTAVVF